MGGPDLLPDSWGGMKGTTGPLQEQPNRTPLYAQLYFYDPQAAANFRFLSNAGLDLSILTELTAFLHTHNPLATLYRTAREAPRFYSGD